MADIKPLHAQFMLLLTGEHYFAIHVCVSDVACAQFTSMRRKRRQYCTQTSRHSGARVNETAALGLWGKGKDTDCSEGLNLVMWMVLRSVCAPQLPFGLHVFFAIYPSIPGLSLDRFTIFTTHTFLSLNCSLPGKDDGSLQAVSEGLSVVSLRRRQSSGSSSLKWWWGYCNHIIGNESHGCCL